MNVSDAAASNIDGGNEDQSPVCPRCGAVSSLEWSHIPIPGKKEMISRCMFIAVPSSLLSVVSFFIVHFNLLTFPSHTATLFISLSAIAFIIFTFLAWLISITGEAASVCQKCGCIQEIEFGDGWSVLFWPLFLRQYLAFKREAHAKLLGLEAKIKARHDTLDQCAEEGKFFYADIPEAYRKKKACLYAAFVYLFTSMAGLWLAAPFVLTKACIFLVSASVSAFIAFIFLLWFLPRTAKRMVICQKCGYITRLE